MDQNNEALPEDGTPNSILNSISQLTPTQKSLGSDSESNVLRNQSIP